MNMFTLKNNYNLFLLLILFCTSASAMNMLRPYDVMFRPDHTRCYNTQIDCIAEAGIGLAKAYDLNGDCINPLHIWQPKQDALKMLEGFDAASPIGQLRIRLDASDDGVRGNFIPTADFQMPFAASLAARYYFFENVSFSAYLPFYVMKLKNVQWKDLTQSLTAADLRVQQFLTQPQSLFFQTVKTLGNGLDLQDWRRAGVGDLTTLVEFVRDFAQKKNVLKNVRIHGHVGASFPTGLKKDEDRLLAIPFGNDGSIGLIFGGGMDLTYGDVVRVGGDIQLIQLFGNTRERRIKTDLNQTDLLLLQKAAVYKDFGLTQRFTLYVEAYQWLKGVSFKTAYQYTKHGDDVLSLVSNDFSSAVINTAESLLEWTTHNMYFMLNVDAKPWMEGYRVIPHASLYYKLPFNGVRSVQTSAVGFELGVSF